MFLTKFKLLFCSTLNLTTLSLSIHSLNIIRRISSSETEICNKIYEFFSMATTTTTGMNYLYLNLTAKTEVELSCFVWLSVFMHKTIKKKIIIIMFRNAVSLSSPHTQFEAIFL